MKNPLVPTQIINKNGVSTTVHKRAASSRDMSSSLPAPVSQTPQSEALSTGARMSMVDYLTGRFLRLHNMEQRYYHTGTAPPVEVTDLHGEEARAFRKQLATYSAELVEKMFTAARDIDHPASGAFSYVREGKSEGYLRTYFVFNEPQHDKVFKFDPRSRLRISIPDAIDSLSAYPHLQYEDAPAYYQKAVAICGVVAAIQSDVPNEKHGNVQEARFITYTPRPEEQDTYLARITNDDLVDLILEHPDKWEDIAEVITTRQTDDAEFIRTIIFTGAYAMREGML